MREPAFIGADMAEYADAAAPRPRTQLARMLAAERRHGRAEGRAEAIRELADSPALAPVWERRPELADLAAVGPVLAELVRSGA